MTEQTLSQSQQQSTQPQPFVLTAAGMYRVLSRWNCPQCPIAYSPGEYDAPHIPGSDNCKNTELRVICRYHAHGEHIRLRCQQCRGAYTTKNISHIGARSIFPETLAWPPIEDACPDHVLIHVCGGASPDAATPGVAQK